MEGGILSMPSAEKRGSKSINSSINQKKKKQLDSTILVNGCISFLKNYILIGEGFIMISSYQNVCLM